MNSSIDIKQVQELIRQGENASVQLDRLPVEGDWKVDLDPVKLHQYWSTYYDIPYEELEAEEQFTILKNADIIVEWEGRYVPSVGGLLIFGKHPHRWGIGPGLKKSANFFG